MGYIIEGYNPARLFNFFEDISAIPRSSGKEKKIADFLESFAKERGLEYYRDSIHNVIIKKSGSLGYEAADAVILQGHTDMVCEKNAGTEHDFANDGIKLVVKDNILSAEGTTLGGDNGIAVAIMLTLLDDKTLIHPPLECVFTVQEETGLTGAQKLDCSKLKGKTMINLDSEEEGVATVSCAGGMRVRLIKSGQWEQASGKGLLIRIGGLLGGHSGADIGLGRYNAIKLMGRLLGHISEDRHFFRVAAIDGGSKDNAIPRECSCVIDLDEPSSYEKVIAIIDEATLAYKKEMAFTEPDFALTYQEVETTLTMSKTSSISVVELLQLIPNGVRARNMNANGFVTCSLNFGAIKATEKGIIATFSLRSSIPSLMLHTRQELAHFAGLFGYAMLLDSCYPGWEYAEKSPVRDIFCDAYKALFDKELKIEAIHAGLECGLLVEKMPDLDVIAVGPSLHDIHTPDESMELDSCERFYKLLCEVLARLAL